MNSFLQQLFMMPALRKEMCAAPLPTSLRTSGGGMAPNGADVVGKKISLQWDTGVFYDAIVEGFDEASGMHVIRYCPLLIANVSGSSNHIQPDDISRIPPELREEFFLSEGRPGKETGVFEVITKSDGEHSGEGKGDAGSNDSMRLLLATFLRRFKGRLFI
jgi:ubiquitin carboxyl-terminal hydrolase 9/24